MKTIIFALLAGAATLSWATIDAYSFKNDADEQQFKHIVGELRCPKCQNQNIADSNAGLAKDIKDRVHVLINEGKSNQEITDYMVERYGDFITYRPPVNPMTWFLWFGPFVLAAGAAIVLLTRKLLSRDTSSGPIDDQQKQKVDTLMKKLSDIESE